MSPKEPKIIIPDPNKIIPFHSAEATSYWNNLYSLGLFGLIPPIPLINAPKDLKHLGDYINYNGHHRTQSAIEMNVKPRAYLLEKDSDIKFLEHVSEMYQEIIEGLGEKFSAHYSFICGEARRYENLRKISISDS